MTEVARSSPVVGNTFPLFRICFLTYGIYVKMLFDKKRHWRQTIASVLFTPYSLTLVRICLLMRNQNTHKNVNYTINTVAI